MSERVHFINKNNNPKNKKTGDCTIRAFMEITDLPIEQIIQELTAIYLKTGWFIDDPRCYGKWLESKGYVKQKQPKHGDNTKYTADEFCEFLTQRRLKNPVIAHVGGHHISVFVKLKGNGYTVQDIWDCTHKCVGNYWIKK